MGRAQAQRMTRSSIQGSCRIPASSREWRTAAPAAVRALQPLGQHVQFRVAAAERLELGDRRQHIVAVGARASVALPDQMQPLIERELAGILRMAAIDHVGQRFDPPLRLPEQRHVAQHLEIDRGHLLALAQIGDASPRARRRRRETRCPRQAPPRSRPSTSPGRSGVPRWTKE